jgi:hypothetical protein
LAPEEKDKHKLYFPESQVGPARKVTGQISINKGDTFLILHTHSLIYSASLVERVAVVATAAEGRRVHMEGLSLLVLVMCWWRPATLALWLECVAVALLVFLGDVLVEANHSSTLARVSCSCIVDLLVVC